MTLDAWITGNYGEDHPDNQQNRHAAEADRIARAHREGKAYDEWVARKIAFRWIADNCDGTHNIGTCPICGERVQVLGSKITMDGRLIASCGDAFTIEQWNDNKLEDEIVKLEV